MKEINWFVSLMVRNRQFTPLDECSEASLTRVHGELHPLDNLSVTVGYQYFVYMCAFYLCFFSKRMREFHFYLTTLTSVFTHCVSLHGSPIKSSLHYLIMYHMEKKTGTLKCLRCTVAKKYGSRNSLTMQCRVMEYVTTE